MYLVCQFQKKKNSFFAWFDHCFVLLCISQHFASLKINKKCQSMRISLYRTQPLTTTAKMPIHSSMFHLGQQTFFGRTELSKFVLAIMTKVSNRKKENETDTILMGEKCFYASGSGLYRHISLPTLSHFRQ